MEELLALQQPEFPSTNNQLTISRCQISHLRLLLQLRNSDLNYEVTNTEFLCNRRGFHNCGKIAFFLVC